MHPLSWWLTHRKQLQPWVGLPNILANEFLVPELLQDQAEPEALCQALEAWLDESQRIPALIRRFESMHQNLMGDTSRVCADAIEKILAS